MNAMSRWLITLAAGFGGGVVGFGVVVLFFAASGLDPGIGGGLLAVVAAIVVGLVASIVTFGRIRPRADSRSERAPADSPGRSAGPAVERGDAV